MEHLVETSAKLFSELKLVTDNLPFCLCRSELRSHYINNANVGNKPKKCNFIYHKTISLWKVHMCWQIESKVLCNALCDEYLVAWATFQTVNTCNTITLLFPLTHGNVCLVGTYCLQTILVLQVVRILLK